MSFKTVGALIGGVKTDIAVSEFVDNYLIVLTQFEKLGAVVTVKKDCLHGIAEDRTIYIIKTELGDEDGPAELVARYLAEQLGINKPAVFCVSLQDSSPPTLRALTQVLRTLRDW